MPIFYGHPLLRTTLYALTWISAAALLGLTASRLKTTHDLSNSHEPIVAELLVTAILAVLWIPFGIFHVLHPMTSRRELIPLSILWIMYLVGAAIATNHWPTQAICNLETIRCNVVIPMIVMAWLGFGFITLLIFFVLLNSTAGYGIGTGATTQAEGAPVRQRAVV